MALPLEHMNTGEDVFLKVISYTNVTQQNHFLMTHCTKILTNINGKVVENSSRNKIIVGLN